MDYANNPQSVYNGYASLFRNVYLTSSIGVAVYGYSNSFKIDSSIFYVKLLSILIFLFSIGIGINGNISFYNYIKKLEKDKENLPNYIDLNSWMRYVYFNIVYLIFLVIIIVLSSRRTINYVTKKLL